MAIPKEQISETLNTPFFFSIRLTYCKDGLVSVDFIEKTGSLLKKHNFSHITRQFIEYFEGKPTVFSNEFLLPPLNNFTLKVLSECCKIPYGKTITYKNLAKQSGAPNAFRAVGGALRQNPLPIIIPCHRVVGSDGKLTGYMGKDGIEIKRCLLLMENAI